MSSRIEGSTGATSMLLSSSGDGGGMGDVGGGGGGASKGVVDTHDVQVYEHDEVTLDFDAELWKRPKIDIDYRNARILAPMVRVSCLPFNLMSLKYGADIVYNEEIIDKKVLQCERYYNPVLDCIEYRKGDFPCFQSFPSATPLVFQMGTASPKLALAAAQRVYHDVDAIDINMGCPKHFSVHAGMGAGLLSTPDVAEDIMRTLCSNIDKPVTCKIRIDDNLDKTIEYCKRMAATGIAALAVHTRTRDERPRQPAHWDTLVRIRAELPDSLPLIANGDVFEQEDMSSIKEQTGVDSVMLARGAMWNASVFRRDGPALPQLDVMRQYALWSTRFDERYQGLKYVLLRMLDTPEQRQQLDEYAPNIHKAIQHSRTLDEVYDILGVTDAVQPLLETRRERQEAWKALTGSNSDDPNQALVHLGFEDGLGHDALSTLEPRPKKRRSAEAGADEEQQAQVAGDAKRQKTPEEDQ